MYEGIVALALSYGGIRCQNLADLEQPRRAICQRMMELPDFRSGSITATYGTCGKPNCRCHQPNQSPHSPNFRLTRKVKGNGDVCHYRRTAKGAAGGDRVSTISRAIPRVDCHQREDLSRPPGGGRGTDTEKKKAETLQQEISHETESLLERIFWQRQKTGGLDLEAVEMAVRCALHQAGANALTELLQFDPPEPEARQLPCPCGHTANYMRLRGKSVLTAVGEAQCLRPYYLCAHCHRGQFPVDIDLDIEDTELSPAVRRMLAAVGT